MILAQNKASLLTESKKKDKSSNSECVTITSTDSNGSPKWKSGVANL